MVSQGRVGALGGAHDGPHAASIANTTTAEMYRIRSPVRRDDDLVYADTEDAGFCAQPEYGQTMRQFLLATLLVLSACATIGESGPSLRYADAASRGAWAALLAGRPSEAQVERATEDWSRALGDSFACRVPMRETLNAGLAGALELGAMNAAMSRGGEREVRDGVARYVVTIASLALERRDRPSDERCEAMAAWAPRVAADGREAVQRARRNGLMDEDYGLLMGLLAR